MTTLYRVEHGMMEPEKTSAEVPSYPNCDAEGRTIYENTHFQDLGMAWRRLLEEANAGESLCARAAIEARNTLERAEAELVRAAIYREKLTDRFRRWP